MIVFDLRCGTGHVFEAWFASSAAFDDQRARQLVACPWCGDAEVAKAVMAPNVSPKGNRAAAPTSGAPLSPEAVKTAMAALAGAQAKLLDGSQWVGKEFAVRARAIHEDGQAPTRIHGQATLAEARALIEEGVPVTPLPIPVVPPDTSN